MDVSRKTDPNLKNTLGVVSYYLWALPELSHMKSVDVTLTVEDTVYEEKMLFMVVMNGRAAGGFKNVAPDAEINDGLLDVLLFKPMPWYKMIPLFVIMNMRGSMVVTRFPIRAPPIPSPKQPRVKARTRVLKVSTPKIGRAHV